MGILSKLFTNGGSVLIDKLGEAIDRNVTSDEERELIKLEAKKAVMGHSLEMAEKARAFEQEITARHRADMSSDSWLSKNIRPLCLAFLLGATVFLVYLTAFSSLTEMQYKTLELWEPLLQALLTTAFVFYYGSRGFEKIAQIKAAAKAKEASANPS